MYFYPPSYVGDILTLRSCLGQGVCAEDLNAIILFIPMVKCKESVLRCLFQPSSLC